MWPITPHHLFSPSQTIGQANPSAGCATPLPRQVGRSTSLAVRLLMALALPSPPTSCSTPPSPPSLCSLPEVPLPASSATQQSSSSMAVFSCLVASHKDDSFHLAPFGCLTRPSLI